MKLSQYAKQLGVTYRTAWNHFKNGQIPNAYKLPSGTIIVPDNKQLHDDDLIQDLVSAIKKLNKTKTESIIKELNK